jgi:signal peptidase II
MSPQSPITRVRFALITLAVIAFDQLTKYWVLYGLGMAQNPDPRTITSFFTLVLWWNKGVSFSMLTHEAISPWMLVSLSLVISVVLMRMAMKTTAPLERIGYALVIGGAIANAIDRVRFGAVADFLYFHIGALGWPAFNMADSAICIGVGLLLIYLFRPQAKP